MLRLLMGITLSEMGGGQRIVYEIIAGLPEDLYEITLLTSPGGELLDWIAKLNGSRENKVKVITLPCLRREVSLLHDPAAFLRVLMALLRGGYDIAHFHSSKMGILGRLAARIAGVPRVYYTVHGWCLNKATAGRLYDALSLAERIAARLTTKVIFVSECDRETGIRNRWASQAASRVIRNGISGGNGNRAGIREALGIPADVPVIVFVARLAEPKDPAFAIGVSGRLAAAGIEHRLLIIGDGPLRRNCELLACGQGPGCRALLLGQRGDVRSILTEADVFCLFTKWEGLPVSIIEAMFAGLPVVASAVGGVPELVEHGVTGYLLDGFDDAKAAGYLAELIRDSELRLRLGRAGREAALEKFTLQGMVAGYRQLYEQGGTNLKMRGRAAWSQRSIQGN